MGDCPSCGCRTRTHETHQNPLAQRKCRSPPYLLQKDLVGVHFAGAPCQWGWLLPHGRPSQDRALAGAFALEKLC